MRLIFLCMSFLEKENPCAFIHYNYSVGAYHGQNLFKLLLVVIGRPEMTKATSSKSVSQVQAVFSSIQSTLSSVFPKPTSGLLRGAQTSVYYDGDHLEVSMLKELATYQLGSADELSELETMLFNAGGFAEYTPAHGFVYFRVSSDDADTHDVRLNVELVPIVNQVVVTLRYNFVLICNKTSEPTNIPAITELKSSAEEPDFSEFHAIKGAIESYLYGEEVPKGSADGVVPLTYTGAYVDVHVYTNLGTFKLSQAQWDALRTYLSGTIAYDPDVSYGDVVRLSSHIARYDNVAEARAITLMYDPEEGLLRLEGSVRLLYHCPA